LVRGTIAHRTSIDGLLSPLIEHWILSRLALVDLCILRLAAYELLFQPHTPSKVAIDEAIEASFGGRIDTLCQRHLDKIPTLAATAPRHLPGRPLQLKKGVVVCAVAACGWINAKGGIRTVSKSGGLPITHSYCLNTKVALVPPNPKELVRATLTSA
jgi:hypothetical protein